MKILYGVCGDGYGHSSRALFVAKHLEKKGHEVLIVTFRRGYEILKDKYSVVRVSGLNLVYEESKVKIFKTIKTNIFSFFDNLKRRKEISKAFRDFNPDLCITDMEVITSHYSWWKKIPSISLNNQHGVSYIEYKFPKKFFFSRFITSFVLKLIIRKPNFYVISSFFKGKVKKENIYVVDPLIRPEVRKFNQFYKNKILVYLHNEDRNIIDKLKKVNENFVIYGLGFNRKEGNVTFKKSNNILKDLKECKAIISNSGYSLMSEAFYLRKPFLAIPLKGAFEQELNAFFLKENGFGDYVFSSDFSEEKLLDFLDKRNKYLLNLKKYKMNPDEVLSVLDDLIKRIKKG